MPIFQRSEFNNSYPPFSSIPASPISDIAAQLPGMAYGSLRRRVADALLRLQEPLPIDELVPPIYLLRNILAAVIGTATESLIRTLSGFKHDGLIDVSSAESGLCNPTNSAGPTGKGRRSLSHYF